MLYLAGAFCLYVATIGLGQASTTAHRRLNYNALAGEHKITIAGLDCQKVETPSQLQLAYRGWPHLISCSVFVDALPFSLDNFDAEIQCLISNADGMVLFNQSEILFNFEDTRNNLGYLISEVSSNSSLNYTLTAFDLSTGTCLNTTVHLNVSRPPNISCEDFLAQKNPTTIPQTFNTGAVSPLSCDLNLNEYPKVGRSKDVSYQWLHNCNDKIGTEKNELFLRWNSTEQGGSYICAARYNGLTRYISAYRYCLHKELPTSTPPAITCDSLSVFADPGDDAQFMCYANFGEGFLMPLSVDIEWRMASNESSTQKCHVKNDEMQRNSPCVYGKPHTQCYEQATTEEEVQQNAVVSITLTIKNISDADFGLYQLIVVKDNKHRENQTLTIAANSVPALTSQAIVTGISIAVVFALLIFIIVVMRSNVYIRVYYKRIFGVYVIDNRSYGATFAYNYSHEIDSFAQQDLKTSVEYVRDSLEDMGYKVYDERRDGSFGLGHSENLFNSVINSHRLVIFLTSNFIKDGWSMLTLHKGFEEMINSRSKIIFILLPGIKEYLKQHAKENHSCELILRAIKLNYAIQWSNKNSRNLKKNYFLFELEDAMPKLTLKSRKNLSIFSISDTPSKKAANSHSKDCIEIDDDVV